MPGTYFGDYKVEQGLATVEIYLTNAAKNAIFCRSTVANIPTGAGYAVGCLLQATDTGNHYINTGSITAASFTELDAGTAFGIPTAATDATTTTGNSFALIMSALTTGNGLIITTAAATTGAAIAIVSPSSGAFKVGSTVAHPAFSIDSSTASQVAGLNVKGDATGGTVAISTTDSGSNTNLSIDGKGTGNINLGGVSTGFISIGRGRVGVPLFSSTVTSLGTTQNSTPTAAQLLGGVVTQTGTTGAGTVTTPTGTVLSAAISGVTTGDTFETLFCNLGGSQNLVITAGATGMTVVGNATVPSGKNALLTFVCTGSNTWNCYVSISA